MMRRKNAFKPLSSKEEIDVAMRMQDEISCIEKLACTTEVGKEIIHRPEVGKRLLTYRVGLVEEAVYTMCSDAETTGTDVADAALAHWHTYTQLMHKLAMSGIRIPLGEAKKFQLYDDAVSDAIQEGIIGLLDAAVRFDPAKEFRFSTYCRWWVKARMSRFNIESRTIRAPVGISSNILTMNRAISEFEDSGEHWDAPILADILGADVPTILRYKSVDALINNVASMEDEVPGTGGGAKRITYESTITDYGCMRQDDVIGDNEMKDAVTDALYALSEKHRLVLTLRFGIDTRIHTLSEIGAICGLSGERARQVIKIALKAVGLRITKTRVKELLLENTT